MTMETTADTSSAFIASQFSDSKQRMTLGTLQVAGPAITISHQTGSGAHETADILARLLPGKGSANPHPWRVIGRDLVEKTLEEHHLPASLARKMPEDRRTYIEDVMDELFGLRPPSWELVPQIVKTIRHLAEMGHVILIGRGSAVVTSHMPNVFHVRLIASLTKRTKRVQERYHLTAQDAARFVEKEDRGRERYVKANFHTRLDNELLYHLVINTDRLPLDDAAELIAQAALRSFANGVASSK